MLTREEQVHIVRHFTASPDQVFNAWTDAGRLGCWFAPANCELAVLRLDPRLGGELVTSTSAPGFPSCTCLATFIEFEPPHRLAFSWSFCDEDGRAISAAAAGRPEWPDRTVVTVTFKSADGGTDMELSQTVSALLAEETGAAPSWRMMLDRLAEELERS